MSEKIGFRPIGGQKEKDPATKIEPNVYLSEGWDVVDPENSYNLPGFDEKDSHNFREVVDADELDLDEGELMSKHELENDFELVDLAQACVDYATGKTKVKPLSKDEDILELTEYYHDRFDSKKEESTLPLSQKETERLSPAELKGLNKALDDISNFSKQMADENEQRGRNFFTKNDTSARPDYQAVGEVNRLNSFLRKIKDAQLNLEFLLAKARGANEGDKSKSEAEDLKRLVRELPRYTEAEKAFLQNCFDFVVHKPGVKTPTFEGKDRQELSEEQVMDGARECAESLLNIPKAKFLEKDFKGQRQLVHVEYLKDGGQVRYIANNSKKQAGNYYYQINPANVWVSKNNPKISFAQVRLLLNSEKPRPAANKQEATA